MNSDMVKSLIGFLLLGILLVIGTVVVLRNNQEFAEEQKQRSEILEVINLEMNPNVSFLINQEGIVKDFILLNEEAIIAYDELEVVNELFIDAIDEVIDQAIDLGFIDDFSDNNTLIFSTSLSDESFKEKIREHVEERLERRDVMGQVIRNEISTTEARETLETRLLMLDENLNAEELKEMRIRELAQLLGEKRTEIRRWAQDKYEVEDLRELRENFQREAQMIRETVRERIEEINGMSAEERQNFLKENRERFEEAIMDVQIEIEEQIGDTRRNYRERIIFGNDATENILREANYLMQVISKELGEQLTSVMRREIMLEIREQLTEKYNEDYQADLETYRQNIIDDILANQ